MPYAMMLRETSGKTALTAKNLAGTYQLDHLTMKIGAGPEKNLSGLFRNSSSDRRLIQLNQDNTLFYLKERRRSPRRVYNNGTWSLMGHNGICIDGDAGIIKKFDGNSLVITSRDDNDFETIITVTYIREQ